MQIIEKCNCFINQVAQKCVCPLIDMIQFSVHLTKTECIEVGWTGQTPQKA